MDDPAVRLGTMANASEIIDVVLASGKTVPHRGNAFHADERGNLVIAFEGSVVCIYAAGQWHKAEKAGNRTRE